MNTIILDQDIESVDFPLVIDKLKIEGLQSFINEDLIKKLNLTAVFSPQDELYQ